MGDFRNGESYPVDGYYVLPSIDGKGGKAFKIKRVYYGSELLWIKGSPPPNLDEVSFGISAQAHAVQQQLAHATIGFSIGAELSFEPSAHIELSITGEATAYQEQFAYASITFSITGELGGGGFSDGFGSGFDGGNKDSEGRSFSSGFSSGFNSSNSP